MAYLAIFVYRGHGYNADLRTCGSADWTTWKMRIRMWMKIRILPTVT